MFGRNNSLKQIFFSENVDFQRNKNNFDIDDLRI